MTQKQPSPIGQESAQPVVAFFALTLANYFGTIIYSQIAAIIIEVAIVGLCSYWFYRIIKKNQ